MGATDVRPESQPPLLELHVDANRHLEMEGETELRCNYNKCIVVLGVTVFVLLIAVIVLAVGLSGHSPAARGPCCPDCWLGYQGKCFYFSTAEGNWTNSRSRCSALGASLAGIDTLQEMAFLLRYKGKPYHWIGLRRDPGQPWKWTNGTKFNNLPIVSWGLRRAGWLPCSYISPGSSWLWLECLCTVPPGQGGAFSLLLVKV
ncbi:C-type lectin domain family 2 member B-like isoform X2 [Pelodiscus sinensis]|uniref:C-type lectin domain family 2 member B-like isoform X2 n=1 Tax=Pelodiscus sinensis TaxID=13735 RepID=UPI003F6C3F38